MKKATIYLIQHVPILLKTRKILLLALKYNFIHRLELTFHFLWKMGISLKVKEQEKGSHLPNTSHILLKTTENSGFGSEI